MSKHLKLLKISALLILGSVFSAAAQEPFEKEIKPVWESKTLILPPSPLRVQILFIGGHHKVQTLDKTGKATEAPAKQRHDFIGYTPVKENPEEGLISVNHEALIFDEKLGDGGGMTVFKVRRSGDSLQIIEQSLEDGRKGMFFNVDFAGTVGETGLNCGGICSDADGRIWTAEEYMYASNGEIFELDGKRGISDTTDFEVSTDIYGDFDGKKIKKFKNFNWMVEIDPKTAKAVRKQYNWGRQSFECGVVLPDNRTVFTGADATPGLLTKFVADKPGDFTKGKTYAYKQSDDGESGSWIEIDNTKMENMLHFNGLSLRKGATMFNRLEWLAYNKLNGKVYITETGRDRPGKSFMKGEAVGGTHTLHALRRAKEQGQKGIDENYRDYYGRILELDPKTGKTSVFLSGGPEFKSSPRRKAYPEKHLSNPDGLCFLHTPTGKSYLVICEDLNGSSMGRTPAGVSNKTCELYVLDMSLEPSVENLRRIAVMPAGAEITGVRATPDGKTLLFNSQHPDPENAFPFNNSVTVAVHGWDKLSTEFSPEETLPSQAMKNGKKKLRLKADALSREITFNETTDAALYSKDGKRLRVVRATKKIDLKDLKRGTYFLKTGKGEVFKVLVK